MRTFMILPMMFIPLAVFAGKTVSLEEALKKNWITAVITGKGGHTGQVIRMKLKNTSREKLRIKIEAGRKLDSRDPGSQDILINKPVVTELMAGESRTIPVYGMCCQASHASPDSGEAFAIGPMADPNMVRLAQYIDSNGWHSNSIAQSAVWVLSDNKPMEDIGGQDAVSKKLQNFISKLTGRPLPKYQIEYARAEGAVHSGVAACIRGTFEYEIFSNGLVTFGIYDAQGRAVQMFFTDAPRQKGRYSFTYSFRTSDLPKGEYFARFRFDGQVKKEEKFVF